MGKRQREEGATFGQLRFKRAKKDVKKQPRFAPSATCSLASDQVADKLRFRMTLEQALPEDIMIRILSYLDASELATVSRVSSEWARLAADPALWRHLYLSTYAKAAAVTTSPVRTRPWRDLYRISSNWRRGVARSTTVADQVRRAVLPAAPADFVDETRAVTSRANRVLEDTLLQFHQQHYLTASRQSRSVRVYRTDPDNDETALVSTIDTRTDRGRVTELRLDEKATALLIGYERGFALFSLVLTPETVEAVEYDTYNGMTNETIMLASLKEDMLATVSDSFTIRFWNVDRQKRAVKEVGRPYQSLQHFCPVFLSLERLANDDGFKAALAFSVPLYPTQHWAVSMQTFTVHYDDSLVTSKHALATSSSTGVITALSVSGDAIVASRDNNTIELYTIMRSASTSEGEDEDAGLIVHVRTLYGHTSAVRSVALKAGRTVSAADDGWRLWDDDEAATSSSAVVEIDAARERVKRVWFDEEKIVGLVEDRHGEQIRVLSFD